ncbi:MAG: phosphoglycerate kinase [Candidatus Andersenbacteria bacterium]|nr:phosphoglycerate kinase [Candidatus Andersenbacteria bacterium]
MKRLRTMDDVLLDGKVVLVRVDFNVPVGADGLVSEHEDYRIRAALPTIEELMQRRCKVVLLTHLSLPGESPPPGGYEQMDMAPIRRRLQELLHEDVRLLKHLSGDEVTAVVSGLAAGSVILLPNVRLDQREMAGSERLAQELASVGEVFVNEAFSVCHRNHTSVTLVPRFLPACAGRRTAEEYTVLKGLGAEPERPYVAVVSGAKVGTKLALLRTLVKQVDRLCLGGVLANTFLVALRKCSTTQCAGDELSAAEALWSAAADKIELPEDVVVGPADGEETDLAGGRIATVSVSEIPPDVGGVWDVGPRTVRQYVRICAGARTVMWNGPLGMVERPAYAAGTRRFAAELASLPAFKIVGGGDTVTALAAERLLSSFEHVSVGGGAMVALLEGQELPGLIPLYVS